MALSAAPAWGKPMFHPRVRNALGLVPPANSQGKFAAQADVASGAPTPVTYHGGSVMAGGITMHLIFWTGGTNPFQGQPPGAPADYVGMMERLYTDVAHDSLGTANVFSVLPQFAQGTSPGAITPGRYSIAFNSASANDVVMDNDPYPPVADQCASPDDTAVCITDGQVQSELDSVISSHGGARGLHDIWMVFLPPGVDECITAGVCGTNASAPTTRSATSATAPRSTPWWSTRSSGARSRLGPTRTATRTPRLPWTPPCTRRSRR